MDPESAPVRVDDIDGAAGLLTEEKAGGGIEAVYPMLPAMRTIYSNPDDRFFTCISLMHVKARLDREALIGRFHRILSAHQALRTVILDAGEGEMVQAVMRDPQAQMFYVDSRSMAKKENYLRTLVNLWAAKGFEEGRALIAGGLIRTKDEEYILFIMWSHLIMDALSLGR